MINKFHVLYVGQIELDNIGRDGTPANDRRYSTERLNEAFMTARDVAQTMDELGFHALWTAEHHFQREGYECLPNLVQLSLWLATQTKRLKFGCAFNVLPMWHPIRLAEDYAMADIVTDGRVIMGVGRRPVQPDVLQLDLADVEHVESFDHRGVHPPSRNSMTAAAAASGVSCSTIWPPARRRRAAPLTRRCHSSA